MTSFARTTEKARTQNPNPRQQPLKNENNRNQIETQNQLQRIRGIIDKRGSVQAIQEVQV